MLRAFPPPSCSLFPGWRSGSLCWDLNPSPALDAPGWKRRVRAQGSSWGFLTHPETSRGSTSLQACRWEWEEEREFQQLLFQMVSLVEGDPESGLGELGKPQDAG